MLTIRLGANKNEVIVPGSNGPVVFDRYRMSSEENNKLRRLVVGAFEKQQQQSKIKG